MFGHPRKMFHPFSILFHSLHSLQFPFCETILGNTEPTYREKNVVWYTPEWIPFHKRTTWSKVCHNICTVWKRWHRFYEVWLWTKMWLRHPLSHLRSPTHCISTIATLLINITSLQVPLWPTHLQQVISKMERTDQASSGCGSEKELGKSYRTGWLRLLQIKWKSIDEKSWRNYKVIHIQSVSICLSILYAQFRGGCLHH